MVINEVLEIKYMNMNNPNHLHNSLARMLHFKYSKKSISLHINAITSVLRVFKLSFLLPRCSDE
jgi:hypothetical protein